MFQTFEDVADPSLASERIEKLRALLVQEGLAGVLVPRADAHQGEYVAPCDERLSWLTGFTGTAGFAIILPKRAALFVDGRYVLQAQAQTDADLFEVLQVPQAKPEDWLGEHLPAGGGLGYDPKLHSIAECKRLTTKLDAIGASLVPVEANLIDRIWPDRPPPPSNPLVPYPAALAGRDATDKIAEIREVLAKADEVAVLLTSPDSIAWLLNTRGGDLPHTPVALAFALVHREGPLELFIDPAKLDSAMRTKLEPYVDLRACEELAHGLARLGSCQARVRLDPQSVGQWFADRLVEAGGHVSEGADPCLRPKATKSEAEIAGTRMAHKRDGVAMARFLCWLDSAAPQGTVDEIAAVITLERFRAQSGMLKEISFDTISGAGPNGAIVHYRVSEATNRRLRTGELYLVDSGAQYEDGTTDITRTIAIGEPSADMRRHATLVLKGHIALSTARFPKGTRGQDLDPFARRPLWQAGLDYDHGTGHGVGSYLSVHEGPQRISRLGKVALEPGMICSNEPGYYREGHYGIRIENLVLVTPLEPIEDGEREMMGFETLTLAPIDRRLIDAQLLSGEERAWLNAYHAHVREEIGPELEGSDRAWLEQATAPIA